MFVDNVRLGVKTTY